MAKESKKKRNLGRWGRKNRAEAYRVRRGDDIRHRGSESRARGGGAGRSKRRNTSRT